jgi:tetratricopeptide (TPR) repeat protein
VAACGKRMELSNWRENDQNFQVEATLSAWRELGPRLIVLDDLNDLGSIRDMLGKLKDGGDIRVLITSRNPNWPPDLIEASLELDVLNDEDSLGFLRQLLSNESKWSDDALTVLAKRLGNLPLPLWLAGQYMANYKTLSVEEYIKRLDNVFEDESMKGWQKEWGNPTQHEMNLGETFFVSWNSLKSEVSKRVFLISTYFSPSLLIPIETLYFACFVDGANIRTKIAILEKAGFFDNIEFDSLVKILESILGISQSDIGSHVNYEGKLTRDESSRMIAFIMVGLGLGKIHAKFYGENIFSDFESLMTEYQLKEDEFPKLLLEIENTGLITFKSGVEQETNNGVIVHPIISEFGRTFKVQFALLSVFLGIFRELMNDDEYPLISKTRKIAEHIEWISKISDERNMFFTGMLWNRLGLLFQANGKSHEAEKFFRNALSSYEKFYHQDNEHVVATLSNLAGSLQDLRDPEADSLYENLYERISELNEDDDKSDRSVQRQSAMLINEGHRYIDKGEFQKALELYKHAYELDKSHYGSVHHEVGTDALSLGNLLRRMKDYEGSIRYLEEALSILEQTDGKNHPSVAYAASNLAMALEDTGTYDRTVELFLRAKDIFSHQMGADNKLVATVCNNLAHCYSSQDKNDAADDMYQLCITILEKDFANNSLDLIPAFSEYGKFLVKINNTRKGYEYLVRALDLEKKQFGEEFENDSSRPASILEFFMVSSMQLIQFERYKEVETRSKQLLELLEQYNLDHTVLYGGVLQSYALSLGA